MKIIWIDGTFGSGKTAVSNAITEKLSNAYLLEFDLLQLKYKQPFKYGALYPEARKYLIEALIKEMQEVIQKECYDYLIIPIALINDYCNERLIINGFTDIKSHHFILTSTNEILIQLINNQKNRDINLAMTYMDQAIKYLNNHYSQAIRIDTSNMSINDVAKKIVQLI